MRLQSQAKPTLVSRMIGKVQQRLSRRGYQLTRVCEDDERALLENANAVTTKFSERVARSEKTGSLETPEERVVEMAAARFIGNAARLVCAGQGTGVFEKFVSVDPALEVTGVIREADALTWCCENNETGRVSFVPDSLAELVAQGEEYDLALALGTIDRTRDVADLLTNVARLAPRAIISANNRAQDRCAGTPPGVGDTSLRRAWTAGEFYWVLRAYYRNVEIYGLADPCVPQVEPVNLFSSLPVLFAVCEN